MNPKVKKILRHTFYGIAFLCLIVAFIFLSEKYSANSKEEVKTITDFYSEINNNQFEVINGTKFINIIKNEKSIVLIGSSTSKWSKKYVEEVNKTIKLLSINRIYYYDINNDKAQQNSNYYRINELLEGYLTETDGNDNNLLAPSLYIIDNGEIKYYNTDTVAMPNKITPDDYWNSKKELEFRTEITEAINKYYLNN